MHTSPFLSWSYYISNTLWSIATHHLTYGLDQLSTYILQPEIPHVTQPYIDDVPVKEPATRYIKEDGELETIPENTGIRQFVWKHFQVLNCVVQQMKYCGGTFSGHKSTLCTPEITVLGHWCTINGRLPDKSRVSKIVNWGPCKDLTNMCAFLGTIEVCRLS